MDPECALQNCASCSRKFTRSLEPWKLACGHIACYNCCRTELLEGCSFCPLADHQKFSKVEFEHELQSFRSRMLMVAEEKEDALKEQYEAYLLTSRQIERASNDTSGGLMALGRRIHDGVNLIELQTEALTVHTPSLFETILTNSNIKADDEKTLSQRAIHLQRQLRETIEMMEETRKLYKELVHEVQFCGISYVEEQQSNEQPEYEEEPGEYEVVRTRLQEQTLDEVEEEESGSSGATEDDFPIYENLLQRSSQRLSNSDDVLLPLSPTIKMSPSFREKLKRTFSLRLGSKLPEDKRESKKTADSRTREPSSTWYFE